MNVRELARIKQYQREFEKEFGKKLHVDWVLMKDLRKAQSTEEVDLSSILEECIENNKASKMIILNGKKLSAKGTPKERNAVKDFCKIVMRINASYDEAAKLINRDRSLIYHYAKM